MISTIRRQDPGRLKKMKIDLEEGAWHGFEIEYLWVESLSNGKYRIENTPFFAKGVSFEDIALGEERDGVLCYVRTAISGGHSTYRILLSDPSKVTAFAAYWKPLAEHGCSYESGDFGFRIYAVDVPPRANIIHVFEFLKRGEEAGVWDFEEGHCEHQVS